MIYTLQPIRNNWINVNSQDKTTPIQILVSYLEYIKNIPIVEGIRGYKIDNYLHDDTFSDARILLEELVLLQMRIEELTMLLLAKVMTELDLELPSELSRKYSNVIERRFSDYSSYIEEDYDNQYYQEFRLAKLGDSSSRQWQLFRDTYASRFEQLKSSDSVTSKYISILDEFLNGSFLETLERNYRNILW